MITYQLEPWAPFIAEVQPLLPKHWKELALNQDEVPLDPQYEEYARRDQAGQVLVVTVREDGAIVGYFIGFIAPGLHYKTCLTCTMDIFWLHPDLRGNGLGQGLFDTIEAELRRRGVNRFFAGCKLHKDVGHFFEKRGYVPVERYYSLWLGRS